MKLPSKRACRRRQSRQLRQLRRGAMSLAMTAVCSLGFISVASAQGFDIQTFSPAQGPDAIFSVEGADTHGHLQPYGALFIDYMNQPLLMGRTDGTSTPVIENRLAAHLQAGIGLGERFQLGLSLPVFLVNDGQLYGNAISGAGLGRLDMTGKASILSSRSDAVGLGVSADVGLPTGDPERMTGSATVRGHVQALSDVRFSTPLGAGMAGLNLGILFDDVGDSLMEETSILDERSFRTALTYGLGAQVEVVEDLMSIGAELFGSASLADTSARNSPLEAILGVNFAAADGLEVRAAAGGGLIGGVGSPRFRSFVGVSYRPTIELQERAEPTVEPIVEGECPAEPEGFTGPYDERGCAVTPETFAGCAGLLEDWEGGVDRWGCPIIDQDGDGVLDWNDQCPDEPMIFIDGAAQDGCPNLDVDGDGIANIEDHCPLEPGLRIYDGCPPEQEMATRGTDQIELRDRVYFQSDRAIIKEESYDLLEQVAWVLRENPDILLIEVAGHTDSRGDADYNMMLSDERAKAVREFLIDRGGIRPSRIDARGYGETELLTDGDSDEDHARNRRVEFRILEQGDEETVAPVHAE